MMIIRAGLVFGFTFHGIALFFGYRTALETIPNLAWPELLLVGGEPVGSNYCGSWGNIIEIVLVLKNYFIINPC